jgi:17beta-estradiol 17-dehydrogenase / very-long-chain 3-oxoacyl-CoA reductase
MYSVKTKHVAVDFGEGRAIYEKIKREILPLDIGVLVNNVGSMHEFPDYVVNVAEDDLWKIMNINVGAVTMMSRMVIPQMKSKRRGAIVNVSSGTENQPTPLVNIYAASKVYTKHFTLGKGIKNS